MAGQWTAPPAHHVLHAETRTRLVQADRVERPAVSANHVPGVLVRRIEDRLQEVHETVRAADVLRRTAPGPVHEGWIFPVRVGQVLDEALDSGRASPRAVAAIRLLMLTGCRKSEVLTLRWTDVDLEAGELSLGDGKTGPRMVPLEATVVAQVFAELRERESMVA